MVKVDLVVGPEGEPHEYDCGNLEFATMPRVGERISVRIDGEPTLLLVASVFHYPLGPSNDSAGTSIRAEKVKP